MSNREPVKGPAPRQAGARVVVRLFACSAVDPVHTQDRPLRRPQSSSAWEAEVQKSEQTGGGTADVQAHCVSMMMTMSSLGSHAKKSPGLRPSRTARQDPPSQRAFAAGRLCSNRLDVDLSAPADQRHHARYIAALDVAGHHIVHTEEACLGESSCAQWLLPPSSLV
jgi:hypothetical protein